MESENNQKIHDVCKSIRIICHSKAIEFIDKKEHSNNANILEIINYTDQKSEISRLIEKNDWVTLFENKQWLSLLDMAYNVEYLYNSDNRISKLLKVVLEFFSQEVKSCSFCSLVK